MSSPLIWGGTNNIGKLLPAVANAGFLSVDTSGNLATNGSTAFTNPVAYTPTLTGFGTVTNSSFTYSRSGKYLIVSGGFTPGTTTAVPAQISLPSGLTIDSAIPVPASSYAIVGLAGQNQTTAAPLSVIAAVSGTSVFLGYFTGGAANPLAPVNGSSGITANTALSMTFTVPISGWSAGPAANFTAPTVQIFLSGSGTYTLPTVVAPLYIKVTMVGGGGGGGSSTVATGTAGGNGGNSTFSANTLSANGGTGGIAGGLTGTAAGGTASNSGGIITYSLSGGAGESGNNAVIQSGGAGGSSYLGGCGPGGTPSSGTAGPGQAAAANSGSGGGGAGGSSVVGSGGGGGAGGYIQSIVTSPSATYTYAVGAAGTAGTGTTNGGAGGSGYILVEEFYQ